MNFNNIVYLFLLLLCAACGNKSNFSEVERSYGTELLSQQDDLIFGLDVAAHFDEIEHRLADVRIRIAISDNLSADTTTDGVNTAVERLDLIKYLASGYFERSAFGANIKAKLLWAAESVAEVDALIGPVDKGLYKVRLRSVTGATGDILSFDEIETSFNKSTALSTKYERALKAAREKLLNKPMTFGQPTASSLRYHNMLSSMIDDFSMIQTPLHQIIAKPSNGDVEALLLRYLLNVLAPDIIFPVSRARPMIPMKTERETPPFFKQRIEDVLSELTGLPSETIDIQDIARRFRTRAERLARPRYSALSDMLVDVNIRGLLGIDLGRLKGEHRFDAPLIEAAYQQFSANIGLWLIDEYGRYAFEADCKNLVLATRVLFYHAMQSHEVYLTWSSSWPSSSLDGFIVTPQPTLVDDNHALNYNWKKYAAITKLGEIYPNLLADFGTGQPNGFSFRASWPSGWGVLTKHFLSGEAVSLTQLLDRGDASIVGERETYTRPFLNVADLRPGQLIGYRVYDSEWDHLIQINAVEMNQTGGYDVSAIIGSYFGGLGPTYSAVDEMVIDMTWRFEEDEVGMMELAEVVYHGVSHPLIFRGEMYSLLMSTSLPHAREAGLFEWSFDESS